MFLVLCIVSLHSVMTSLDISCKDFNRQYKDRKGVLMQNSDTMVNSSRAELIRSARESCNKNLNHNRSNNQGMNKRISTIKRDGQETSLVRSSVRSTDASVFYSKSITIKLFIARVVVSVIILLSIIVMDQMKISYHNVNSTVIKNTIQSNESTEKAVDFVATFTKENILSVFNGK